MDPKLIQAALDALIASDTAACEEILKKMLVEAAGGSADEGEPASGTDATQANADPPAPPAPGEEAPPPEEMQALSRELVALSGAPTVGEAAAYFKQLHESASATRADRATLEASERRGLVAELVKLGIELPHRAWADDAEGDARTPCARLAGEPLLELRSRVAELRSARGTPRTVTPPTPAAKVVALSKAERDYCAREKITPEEFAARKASAAKRSK